MAVVDILRSVSKTAEVSVEIGQFFLIYAAGIFQRLNLVAVSDIAVTDDDVGS